MYLDLGQHLLQKRAPLAPSMQSLQATTLSRQVASLDSQRDPARLEAAAVAIVGSGNAKAIQKLAA